MHNMENLWNSIFNVVTLVGIIVTIFTIIPVAREIKHHPKGLKVLFFAEMWERFSYYGMRGLLTLYLVQHFLFSQESATKIYSSYTSLVYLLPLVGGILADKYIGTRKAVAFGALALVAGHFTMGLEGKPAKEVWEISGKQYEFVAEGRNEAFTSKIKVGENSYEWKKSEKGIEIIGLPADAPIPSIIEEGSYTKKVVKSEGFGEGTFFLALSLIILGVGFLKPNISAIVGQLYGKDDVRRDPGFTLYYYGINLGAFWASILCGALATSVGWWAGFGLAGVGMLAGYIAFVRGKPSLEGHGEPPDPEKLAKKIFGPLTMEHLIYLGAVLSIPLIWLIVQKNDIVGYGLGAGSVIVLGYIFYHMATQCTKEEAQRLALSLVLIAASVVFFVLFEQAGSSLSLFAASNVNLPSNGFWTVTTPQTQAFNAGFILIFAPIFAYIWSKLGQKNKDPNSSMKFGLALIQVGAGFLVLVWGAQFANAEFRVPLIFLVLMYLLHTTGELFLSPVGLSAMTKLSTPKLISTLMATWFLASSWAQYIGGAIAKMTASETVAGQVMDPAAALAKSVEVFTNIGLISIAIGIGLALLSPFLNKMAHGVK